jgi:hypothetical protein
LAECPLRENCADHGCGKDQRASDFPTILHGASLQAHAIIGLTFYDSIPASHQKDILSLSLKKR